MCRGGTRSSGRQTAYEFSRAPRASHHLERPSLDSPFNLLPDSLGCLIGIASVPVVGSILGQDGQIPDRLLGFWTCCVFVPQIPEFVNPIDGFEP